MRRVDIRGRKKLRQYNPARPYQGVRILRRTLVLAALQPGYKKELYGLDMNLDIPYCLDRTMYENSRGESVLPGYSLPGQLYYRAIPPDIK